MQDAALQVAAPTSLPEFANSKIQNKDIDNVNFDNEKREEKSNKEEKQNNNNIDASINSEKTEEKKTQDLIQNKDIDNINFDNYINVSKEPVKVKPTPINMSSSFNNDNKYVINQPVNLNNTSSIPVINRNNNYGNVVPQQNLNTNINNNIKEPKNNNLASDDQFFDDFFSDE